ncbi:hypothetical protein CJZ72_12395 [Enterococcus durans]|nr:hypothetical protein CJZ72_12395 [Enterococcus durans]
MTGFSILSNLYSTATFALSYSYSNGPLECLNNHIKVLKRNAYGFCSFYNFKLQL